MPGPGIEPGSPCGHRILSTARAANARLSTWLAQASNADLLPELEFQTISVGTHRASARKVVAHTFLHGSRTWAQLATAVRLHGIATGWRHDLLMNGSLD